MTAPDLHEFQNAVQLVLSNCELALFTIRIDDPARHDVTQAVLAARKLVGMTREIEQRLDFRILQVA